MTTRVFYATNRAPIGDATVVPHYALDAAPGEHSALRTGIAEVTTAAGPEDKRIVENVFPDRDNDLVKRGKQAVAPAIAAWADAAVTSRQDAVLFIHGFANTWTDSICRAAQLRDFYAIPSGGAALPFQVLAFGWPSDGQIMPPSTHYPADRKDAAAAALALAALLAQIAVVAPAIRGVGARVNLIAHSMGNWALRNALLAYKPTSGKPLFDEVLLTAPDEDDDALTDGDKLGLLFPLCQRVTAHVYDWDVILSLSSKINGRGRLGQDWPIPVPNIAGRDDAVLRVSPVIIELTDPNLTGHQYYRNNAAVRRDVIAVLGGLAQAEIRGRAPDPACPCHFVLFGASPGSPTIT